tara:strand:+ start:53 stop:259 length:207 start_codon:yes stop_codon:yes gene_type:complete
MPTRSAKAPQRVARIKTGRSPPVIHSEIVATPSIANPTRVGFAATATPLKRESRKKKVPSMIINLHAS